MEGFLTDLGKKYKSHDSYVPPTLQMINSPSLSLISELWPFEGYLWNGGSQA